MNNGNEIGIGIIFSASDGCTACWRDTNDCCGCDNASMWTALDFPAFDTAVLQATRLKACSIRTPLPIPSSVSTWLLSLESLSLD